MIAGDPMPRDDAGFCEWTVPLAAEERDNTGLRLGLDISSGTLLTGGDNISSSRPSTIGSRALPSLAWLPPLVELILAVALGRMKRRSDGTLLVGGAVTVAPPRVKPFTGATSDCRDVRLVLVGALAGPIEVRLAILGLPLIAGTEGFGIAEVVPMLGVEFPDDVVDPKCLIDDLVGDYGKHQLPHRRTACLICLPSTILMQPRPWP